MLTHLRIRGKKSYLISYCDYPADHDITCIEIIQNKSLKSKKKLELNNAPMPGYHILLIADAAGKKCRWKKVMTDAKQKAGI
jgi:hypothetical protein